MTAEDDIIERLVDLHKQATVERSHYYTGKCIRDAIAEIQLLRTLLAAASVKPEAIAARKRKRT